MLEIPTPSKEEVEKYLDKWDSLENYVYQENSLNKLFFDLILENKEIEDIIISYNYIFYKKYPNFIKK